MKNSFQEAIVIALLLGTNRASPYHGHRCRRVFEAT